MLAPFSTFGPELCARSGFRGGPLLDVPGTLQFLHSGQVRERDKALLRSVLLGGVCNGFLLTGVTGQPVPRRFCGAPNHDGHLFWECTFSPLVEIRENPEFHDLMRMDKSSLAQVSALAWVASYAFWCYWCLPLGS